MYLNNLVQFVSEEEFKKYESLIPKPFVAMIVDQTGKKFSYRRKIIKVDVNGLKEIGWSDEDINNFCKYAPWPEEDKDLHLVPQSDKDLVPMDRSKIKRIVNYCPTMDTTQITDMCGFFNPSRPSRNYHLTGIPTINTKNVTDMNGMFKNCSDLICTPDLDTKNVTDMCGMFLGCGSLVSVGFLDITNALLTDGGRDTGMFDYCSNLKEIKFRGKVNSKNDPANLNLLFDFVPDGGKFYYDGNKEDFQQLIDILIEKNWEIIEYFIPSVVLSIQVIKDGVLLTGDQDLTINGLKLTPDNSNIYHLTLNFNSKDELNNFDKKLYLNGEVIATIGLVSQKQTVYNPIQKIDTYGLKEIGWTEDDIKNLTDNCWWSDEIADQFSVSDVEKKLMPIGENEQAINTIKSHKEIKYSPSFKITDPNLYYAHLFQNCKDLIAVPKLDLSKSDCTAIFSGCSKLKNIHPDTLVLSETTSIGANLDNTGFENGMFNMCSSLQKIEMDLGKTIFAGAAFSNCGNLQTLKLKNTNHLSYIREMFTGCPFLNHIEFFGGMKNFNEINNFLFDVYGPNKKIFPNGDFIGHLPGHYDYMISYFNDMNTDPDYHWNIKLIGDVNIKIKVIKDGVMLTGDQNLTVNNEKLNYLGDGLYGKLLSFNYPDNPIENFDKTLHLDGVNIGTIDPQIEEVQKIYVGNNDSVRIFKTGDKIVDIIDPITNWTVNSIPEANIIEFKNLDSSQNLTTEPINIKFNLPFEEVDIEIISYRQDYNSNNIKDVKFLDGQGNNILTEPVTFEDEIYIESNFCREYLEDSMFIKRHIKSPDKILQIQLTPSRSSQGDSIYIKGVDIYKTGF